MKQNVKVQCPVCQETNSVSLASSVNADQEKTLKKELMEGRLHQFECSNCGARRLVELTFLYHDPSRAFMIVLLPRLKQRQAEVEAVVEKVIADHPVDVSHYELRLVKNHAELVEKIQLFENNYNDREVEIVKLLTDGLFAKERPKDQVKARYFIMKNDQPKIMYITDSEQLLVDFNDSLLDFAKNKFKNLVATGGKGEFLNIDPQWAAQALTNN